jgi:hypothetical protein
MSSNGTSIDSVRTDFGADSIELGISHDTPETNIERAEKEFLYHGEDHSWIPDPSIIAIRSFAALRTENKMRNFGYVHQCTHYLEVGDWAHNCPELAHVVRPVAAYKGYGHDLGEDIEGVTPEQIVMETWKGSPNVIPYLIKGLRQLYDRPELRGKARLKEQVRVAKEEMGHVGNYVRYADKYCSLYRDRWSLQNELKIFSHKNQLHYYFIYLDRRKMVVHRLRIEQKYRDQFDALWDEVRQTVTQQVKTHSQKSFSFSARSVLDRASSLSSAASRTLDKFASLVL